MNFLKSTIVAIASFLFVNQLFAHNGADNHVHELEPTSKIENVTVFLRSAQIERTSTATIDAGTNILKFEYLSPNIDANSIKVTGKGDFTILSVNHSINHLREGRLHAKVKVLQDSITTLQNDIKLNGVFNSALDSEWEMIVANKTVNTTTGFDIEDLDDLALYYQKRLKEIAIEQQEISNKNVHLEEIKQKIVKQIGELNQTWNKATSEILVEVKANKRSTAKLELVYIVTNAGWIPNYDIRVDDNTQPVTLNYKAKVYQNTGIDWNNVNLTLATNSPMVNATKPNITPWYLRFMQVYSNNNVSRAQTYEGKKREKYDTYAAMSQMDEVEMEDAETTANYVVESENQLNTTFAIEIPYTIESNGKYNDVSVKSNKLASTYNYFTIPKSNNNAFLLARVPGWDKLNLLPGMANIFYEGTYTGKSFINPNIAEDTLDLSLGVDNGIVITRKKVDEFCKKQNIGANKTETVGIEITIRNTKKQAIEIDVMDQIPLSTNKEIVIELEEKSGASYEEKTGYLSWNLNLASAETKKLLIKYTVKIPKEQRVRLE